MINSKLHIDRITSIPSPRYSFWVSPLSHTPTLRVTLQTCFFLSGTFHLVHKIEKVLLVPLNVAVIKELKYDCEILIKKINK